MLQQPNKRSAANGFFNFSRNSLILLLTMSLAILLADWLSYHYLLPVMLENTSAQIRNNLQRKINIFERNLDKYRYLPLTLAFDSELQNYLIAPQTIPYQQVSQKLRDISLAIGADQVFLASTSGIIVASEQSSGPNALRGHDISFRPYFREAISGKVMTFYAVGTTENMPGYYLSTRMTVRGKNIGVLALKINMDQLFIADAPASEPLTLSEASGIIITSNIPGWKYHTLGVAEAKDLQTVTNTRQFGGYRISPLPGVSLDNHLPGFSILTINGQRFLASRAALPGTSMYLTGMQPVQPVYRDIWLRIALLDSILTSMIFFGYLVSQRIKLVRKIAENNNAIKNAYNHLEILVAERNRELQTKNLELENEIAERLGFEERERNLQKELIRTEKLAVIGQLSAGLAHEINQPLAAIRAYSENTLIFLQRGNTQAVGDNLVRIAALIDRIGVLTGQLRSFARPSDETISQVGLSHCIDNVMMLLRHRLEKKQIVTHKDFPPDEIYAQCNGLRLEQVLVNLLANAIDVLDSNQHPAISLRLFRYHSEAIIEVSDNGPGLSAEVIDHIFEPFFTTKTTTGLGLGLAISADIIKSFHGNLSADNLASGGARFTIRLQLSPQQQENLIG